MFYLLKGFQSIINQAKIIIHLGQRSKSSIWVKYEKQKWKRFFVSSKILFFSAWCGNSVTTAEHKPHYRYSLKYYLSLFTTKRQNIRYVMMGNSCWNGFKFPKVGTDGYKGSEGRAKFWVVGASWTWWCDHLLEFLYLQVLYNCIFLYQRISVFLCFSISW